MPQREASIKVSLSSGTFVAGLSGMESKVRSSGARMGAALRVPISAGLASVKKSIVGFGSEIKRQIGTAMKLGGALATGMLIRDATKLHSVYRSISFTTEKIPGQVLSWQEVQKLVSSTAERTGRSSEELAESFHDLLKSTGNLEFSKTALESIGTAASGTYEDIGNITKAAELMKRKFSVADADINAGLSKFIALTGSGGKSLDELTGRFAVMAGEARNAGMQGVDGIGDLLGLLLILDESIGEKADPGLKAMFQTMKDGSAQFVRLQKLAHIKFKPDTSALEKIRTMLTTVKGRAAAEMVFTADARQVFDTLAKPFDLAMSEAKEKGLKKADALNFALEAFDANIRNSSKSTMTWGDIQKRAATNLKEDPSLALKKAMEKIRDAFAQPKMITAIEKLAEKLPALADALADLVSWVVENPVKAGMAGAGLKVGGSFAAGVAGATLPGMLKALFGFGGAAAATAAGGAATAAGGAATAAGGAGAAGGAAAAASKVGLVWRGLASAGSALAAKFSAAGAGAAGGGAAAGVGGAAMAAGAAAGGAVIGAAVGTIIDRTVTGPIMKADFARLDSVDALLAEIKRVRQDEAASLEQKEAALSALQEKLSELKEGPSAWTGIIGEITSWFSDVGPAQEGYTRQMEDLAAEEFRLKKSITEQADAWGDNKKKLNEFAQSVFVASEALKKMGEGGTTHGSVNNLPNKPGASPTGAHQ